MDDYEKLQWELQELYTVFLERFRNLEYLEMELDHFDRAEQEKMEDADRQLKKMQRRLRDEVRARAVASIYLCSSLCERDRRSGTHAPTHTRRSLC
jgi:hypothetical protein